MRIRTALGCYLDCKRQRPDLSDALQQQADMALRQACSDKNLKWVSLLLWVGADPRAKGLVVDDLNDPDIANDPEARCSALQEACICGHVDIVKRLKPDPAHDDLGELLREASTFAKRDVIAYLLSLGADPNDKPNGGSSALDVVEAIAVVAAVADQSRREVSEKSGVERRGDEVWLIR